MIDELLNCDEKNHVEVVLFNV